MKVSYNDSDQDTCININEMQRNYFEKCLHLAQKSNLTQKHGCVLVKNNKIISCGYNFKIKNTVNSPFMTNSSSSSSDNGGGVFSVHAEISTIKKVKKQDLSKCELYVIRIGPGSTTNKIGEPSEIDTSSFRFKYSCPCSTCAKMIQTHRIKKVYYSINS
jgi:deoxycytidylate deaminase